tara:strand:- start:167 stop:364 length:198 start_codon:yes stop_codon:yes gene_type:complete
MPQEKILVLIASDCHSFEKFVVWSVVRDNYYASNILNNTNRVLGSREISDLSKTNGNRYPNKSSS